MTTPTREDLGETRYVTLILRLLLDEKGRVLNGELADINGDLIRRFAGSDGLASGLRTVLAEVEAMWRGD